MMMTRQVKPRQNLDGKSLLISDKNLQLIIHCSLSLRLQLLNQFFHLVQVQTTLTTVAKNIIMKLDCVFVALCWSSFCIYNVLGAVIDPIVETTQGKLKGKLAETRNGRKFVQFLGIPYAKKPQRFQEAGPPEKWEGIRDGTKFGSPCVQFDRKTKGVVGDENCLFLNIYTPVIPKTDAPATSLSTTTSKPGPLTSPTPPPRASRKLPVLVYIHGGSFVGQSGQLFGAKYFLDEDVLLITLNYRLGALGFLSTGDNESVGNLGLRDQIAALKWIQGNIDKFGGDASRVTLVGGSAGGAMASFLMLSPMAKGLFSRVISQSGNALCPWVIVRNPAKVAQKLATKLNCPTNGKSSRAILDCIKGKSIKDIEIARVALQGFAEDPAVPFAPVVEKWVQQKDKAVVPDLPQKMISEGKAAHIPWLTGYNSLNGLNLAVANILTTPKRLEQLNKDWIKLAPLIFHYSQSAPFPGNVSEAVRQYYFGNGMIKEGNKEKLVIALTDRNFIYCTAEAALAQSKYAPVYLYTLSYQGANSFLDEWGVRDKIKMRGVVHNDELPFLFNLEFSALPELKKDDKHTPFSEKMVKIWSEFAKTGKPLERHGKTEFEWSPVLPSQTTSNLKWYQLDSTSQSSSSIIPAPTFKIWEGLDLGQEEGYLRNHKDNGKIVVGYTMTDKPTVKPITHAPPIAGKQAITSAPSSLNNPGSSSGTLATQAQKPSSLNSGVQPSGQLPYGLSPVQQPALVGTSSTTTAKPASKITSPTPSPSFSKPIITPSTSEIPPPAIHAVFKDEDPYSSTTTTTTKKPGFFSKLIGG